MPTTILIVEENNFLRRTLGWWVKTNFPGYHVIEASNEQEAIALAQSSSPAVVIMDNIPLGMNNLEFIVSIKAIIPTTQVIVLTFYEDEIYYANETSDGVSAYISHEKIQTKLQPTLAMLLSSQEGWNEYAQEQESILEK